jgi:hypothetical protein
VAAIVIVLVVLKVTNAKNVMLQGRIDSNRARAQAAERVAFRVTGVAETAVNEVALKMRKVSGQMDALMDHVGIEPSAPRMGKHELRVLPGNKEGDVA